MKTLVLRARDIVDDEVRWHDSFILLRALEEIAKKKPMAKATLWANIASRVYLEQEAADLLKNMRRDIAVDLRNVEARLLWKELNKLTPEQYGRDMEGNLASPPLALLHLMRRDFATDLGQELPEVEEDEEEDEEE